jgi:hypothetical protein
MHEMAVFDNSAKSIYKNLASIYMATKRASRAAKGKANIITIESAANQVEANANLKTASTTDISGKVKFLAKH